MCLQFLKFGFLNWVYLFDYLLSLPHLLLLLCLHAGVVNAFNLIDGLNGLSSYITISTAIALSLVAVEVGANEITIFLTLVSAIVLGFMVLNFPFGKIFLGDAEPTFMDIC